MLTRHTAHGVAALATCIVGRLALPSPSRAAASEECFACVDECPVHIADFCVGVGCGVAGAWCGVHEDCSLYWELKVMCYKPIE